MLFDIGPGEFLVIAIVGLLIVGPDRLPKMLAEGVKWLRVLRDQAVKARGEIVAAADIDPSVTEELRRSVSDSPAAAETAEAAVTPGMTIA